MPITNSGVNLITQRLFKNHASSEVSYQPMDATNTRIGIGRTNTAFAKTDAELADTAPVLKGMDSGFPKVDSSTTIFKTTYQATFGSNDANFTWQEWGLFNGEPKVSRIMLNRVVANNGTKVQGQVWTMTVVIEINPA